MDMSRFLSSIIDALCDSGTFREKLRRLVINILNDLGYGKARQTDDSEPLKEWIPTVFNEKYDKNAKLQGQSGLWKAVLMPYVAAYIAGYERQLTAEQFGEKFGIKVPEASFQNWTKAYFPGCAKRKNLYERQELMYWWRRLGLSYEEIKDLIQDLQEKELL